jgi:hypothetical protein
MWALWWTKRHWGRFSPSTSVSTANHSTDFSIIIITRGWHNRPLRGRSVEWTLIPPPLCKLKKKHIEKKWLPQCQNAWAINISLYNSQYPSFCPLQIVSLIMKTIMDSCKYKCCRFRKKNSEKLIILLLDAWVRVQVVLSLFFLLKEKEWYRDDNKYVTLTYFQNSHDNEKHSRGHKNDTHVVRRNRRR